MPDREFSTYGQQHPHQTGLWCLYISTGEIYMLGFACQKWTLLIDFADFLCV